MPLNVFLSILWKVGVSEQKEYKVATWNCHIHSYNRNSHMHIYNKNSHVHNALQIIMWRKMWTVQKCGEKPIRQSIKVAVHLSSPKPFQY